MAWNGRSVANLNGQRVGNDEDFESTIKKTTLKQIDQVAKKLKMTRQEVISIQVNQEIARRLIENIKEFKMANLEVYFPDNTALHFTDQGVTDEDATICDSCDTKQFLSGGIVSDQIFVCAKCRVADE